MMTNLRKCPLCHVEYLGAEADHDCEATAWARPHPQPIGPAIAPTVNIFDDLAKVST